MLRGVTLGQYIPIDSTLHSLDPRTKIVLSLGVLIILFFINDALGYGLIFGLIALGVILARIPLVLLLRSLKPIVWIVAITFAMQIFFTEGHVIAKYSFLEITREGIKNGIEMTCRLGLLMVSSALLTLTTSPIELTDGLERLLNPLKIIGVPAHELSMMMTIALRFIPALIEETEKIMNAQLARGADFASGGLIGRAKSLVPLLVPLFVSAFKRADELAIAMEARGYRGGIGRTRLRQLKMSVKDSIVISTCIPLMVFAAIMH
jgi:energy-coupling factor transport system permease protein